MAERQHRQAAATIAPSDTMFAIGVTLLFTLICGFAISYHEMWRDELQAWLLARDSSSVAQLLQRIKYEGHPALWYLLLFALTRITHRPEAMQLLHLGIAAACAFLFARAAPFPRSVRLLFCLGYFPLYEYGVIARNYSLGVLFLFAAAALFPQRRERPWLLGIVLAVAAHTIVHVLFIAAAVAGAILLEPFFSRDPRARFAPAAKTFGIAAVGILVAVFRLPPPPDSGFYEAWVTQWIPSRAENVLGLFAQALLPIPGGRGLWGDLWLEVVSRHVAPLLSLLFFGAAFLHLRRRPVGLVTFAAGTTALLAFFYTKYDGSIRHHGFLLINLVVALWLAAVTGAESDSDTGRTQQAAISPWQPLLGWLAAAVLVIQLAAAAIAVRQDVTLVFSAGRATAALLVERGLDALPLVGDADYAMPPVLGYLDGRSMYYLRGERFGSFVVLDRARRGVGVTDEKVFAAARTLAEERHSSVGIVLNRHASPSAAGAAEELGCFSADITRPESYCVYRLALP